MNNKQLLKELKELDTLIENKERPDGTTYTCFTDKALSIGDYHGKDKSYYFNKLSNLVYNADVSTEYAYQWLEYAIACLIDVVDYLEPKEEANTEEIIEKMRENEICDSVYTSDHTDFISQNSWAVDDVVAEWDIQDNIVASAYYKACGETVEQFAYEILEFILD